MKLFEYRTDGCQQQQGVRLLNRVVVDGRWLVTTLTRTHCAIKSRTTLSTLYTSLSTALYFAYVLSVSYQSDSINNTSAKRLYLNIMSSFYIHSQ